MSEAEAAAKAMAAHLHDLPDPIARGLVDPEHREAFEGLYQTGRMSPEFKAYLAEKPAVVAAIKGVIRHRKALLETVLLMLPMPALPKSEETAKVIGDFADICRRKGPDSTDAYTFLENNRGHAELQELAPTMQMLHRPHWERAHPQQ